MPTRRVNAASQNRGAPIKPGRLPCMGQTSNNPATTTTSTTTITTAFTPGAPTVTFMHTTTLSAATVALQTLLLLCMPPELSARPLLQLLGDIARTQTTPTGKGGKTSAAPSARHQQIRRRRFVRSHEQLMSQFTGGTVMCTSQTGFNLALGPGGTVYGVPHSQDPHGKLHFMI